MNPPSQVRLADCAAEDIVYEAIGNAHKLEGVLNGRGLELISCLSLCAFDADCEAVDWVQTGSGDCYTFATNPGDLEPSDCCIHIKKICRTSLPGTPSTPTMTLPSTSTSTSTPPTTTTTTTTTPPPTTFTTTSTSTDPPITTSTGPPNVITTTTQNPNDVCNSGYQIIPGQYQDNGQSSTAPTLQACLQDCETDVTCVAADYNVDAPVGFGCFKHTSVVVADINTNAGSCCTRYIKVNCIPKGCYEYPEVDLVPLQDDISLLQLFFDTLNVRPGGLASFPVVPCDGACITEEVANFSAIPYDPYTISRRCEMTVAPSTDKACIVTVDPDTDLTTTTCRCYGDICNAFGADMIESCVAYYPFDANPNDATVNNRNGVATNVLFDAIDSQKNFSANFNGQSFINIATFRNFPWGQIPGFRERTPAFTITAWVKRTGQTGRQVILSNGPVGSASLVLYSQPDIINPGFYFIRGDVRIGGVLYTVTSPTRKTVFGAWHFVALTITSTPLLAGTVPFYYVQLFVDDIILPPVTDVTSVVQTTVLANTTTQGIDPSIYGLGLGSQASATGIGVLVGADVDFFVGNIDELYLFDVGLRMSELESVMAVSATMGLFLP